MMTKQEKIREGIKLILKEIPRDIHKYLNNPNDAPSYDYYIGRILTHLHSQGVVIKVDRELPEELDCPDCPSPECRECYQCYIYEGFKKAVRAGYGAFKPLIKEEIK